MTWWKWVVLIWLLSMTVWSRLLDESSIDIQTCMTQGQFANSHYNDTDMKIGGFGFTILPTCSSHYNYPTAINLSMTYSIASGPMNPNAPVLIQYQYPQTKYNPVGSCAPELTCRQNYYTLCPGLSSVVTYNQSEKVQSILVDFAMYSLKNRSNCYYWDVGVNLGLTCCNPSASNYLDRLLLPARPILSPSTDADRVYSVAGNDLFVGDMQGGQWERLWTAPSLPDSVTAWTAVCSDSTGARLAVQDGARIFLSTDQGVSWMMLFNSSQSFEGVDPKSWRQGGLSMSRDGLVLYAAMPLVTSSSTSSDQSYEVSLLTFSLTSEPSMERLQTWSCLGRNSTLLVSSANGSVLALGGGCLDGGLQVSTNHGRSFKKVRLLSPVDSAGFSLSEAQSLSYSVYSLALSGDGMHLYAMTDYSLLTYTKGTGVLVSTAAAAVTDDGDSAGLGEYLVVACDDSGQFVAVLDGLLSISTNYGRSFMVLGTSVSASYGWSSMALHRKSEDEVGVVLCAVSDYVHVQRVGVYLTSDPSSQSANVSGFYSGEVARRQYQCAPGTGYPGAQLSRSLAGGYCWSCADTCSVQAGALNMTSLQRQQCEEEAALLMNDGSTSGCQVCAEYPARVASAASDRCVEACPYPLVTLYYPSEERRLRICGVDLLAPAGLVTTLIVLAVLVYLACLWLVNATYFVRLTATATAAKALADDDGEADVSAVDEISAILWSYRLVAEPAPHYSGGARSSVRRRVQVEPRLLFTFATLTILPYLDTFSDLLYVLGSKFYRVWVFCVVLVCFVLHPALSLLLDLWSQRAWVQLRCLPWLLRQLCPSGERVSVLGLLFLVAFAVPALLLDCLWVATWLVLGFLLISTKMMCVGPLYNLWYAVWTGRGAERAPSTRLLVIASWFKREIYSGIFRESIPQLAFQTYNAVQLEELDTLTIFSISMSAFTIYYGVYRFFFLRYVVRKKVVEERTGLEYYNRVLDVVQSGDRVAVQRTADRESSQTESAEISKKTERPSLSSVLHRFVFQWQAVSVSTGVPRSAREVESEGAELRRSWQRSEEEELWRWERRLRGLKQRKHRLVRQLEEACA